MIEVFYTDCNLKDMIYPKEIFLPLYTFEVDERQNDEMFKPN